MASKAPPPSTAAGVPPSGNGKYIVIALLLLAAVGGVIFWKLSQKPPEPVVVRQIPDAGSSPKPKIDDDIPPPPPVEDAGADAGKKVVYVGTPSQCDAKKCAGGTTSELEQTLAFRAKQAHRCYDNALTQDPTLKGKISIAVRVGANGTVCSAAVASNELGSPTVANCVAGYFRSGSFPPPKGGCADVNIPINFVPRQ